MSKYDLTIIDTILGVSDCYGKVNVESDKVIQMLNYIDLCGLYATSDNCEMYIKIVDADTEAFTKQMEDKAFHYIALCIDFDNRTVSILYIYDTDDKFWYGNTKKVGD